MGNDTSGDDDSDRPLRHNSTSRNILPSTYGWDVELSRRLAEIDNGKVQGIPAEIVMDRLRAMYP